MHTCICWPDMHRYLQIQMPKEDILCPDYHLILFHCNPEHGVILVTRGSLVSTPQGYRYIHCQIQLPTL